MFSKKNKEPMPDYSDVNVKLKPIFGIKPGLYLTVIYSIIIVLIIFMTLFYPGITKNGTYVNFLSTPDKASVWIDDVFKGITPCEVFVEAGERKIEFRKAFYKTTTLNENIDGRLFATILFPLKSTIAADIEIEDLNQLIEYSLKDFAEWGMIDKFVLSYHLPPILSETAKASRYLTSIEDINKLYSFIYNAVYFTDSPEELKEIINALIVTETKNRIIEANSVALLINRAKDFISTHDNFPYWLINSLPQNLQEESGLKQGDIINSEWFKAFNEKHLSAIEAIEIGNINRQTSRININSIIFHLIPSGSYLSGNELKNHNRIDNYFSVPFSVEEFYLAETEVTNKQYYEFVAENPKWSKINIEQLIKSGKVTIDYLTDWSDDNYIEGMEDYPVLYVSYYAAEAFCEWFNSKLPNSMKNYTVRLPYETEWEWAAVANGPEIYENAVLRRSEIVQETGTSNAGIYGHKDLIGNVWEWSKDYYLPVKNLLASLNPDNNSNINNLYGSEIIVKGGSFINNKSDISTPFVRGSQPPEWCTQFLGFRIAIAE